MKRRYVRKPVVQYRFKDNMNCVFFRNFRTDREARLWYERNKTIYSIKEFGSMGTVYPTSVLVYNTQ